MTKTVVHTEPAARVKGANHVAMTIRDLQRPKTGTAARWPCDPGAITVELFGSPVRKEANR